MYTTLLYLIKPELNRSALRNTFIANVLAIFLSFGILIWGNIPNPELNFFISIMPYWCICSLFLELGCNTELPFADFILSVKPKLFPKIMIYRYVLSFTISLIILLCYMMLFPSGIILKHLSAFCIGFCFPSFCYILLYPQANKSINIMIPNKKQVKRYTNIAFIIIFILIMSITYYLFQYKYVSQAYVFLICIGCFCIIATPFVLKRAWNKLLVSKYKIYAQYKS